MSGSAPAATDTVRDALARTHARAHTCTHQHALHALCLAPPPSGLFASMKMRVNLVKSSHRWDVASFHCEADCDRSGGWMEAELRAPAVTDQARGGLHKPHRLPTLPATALMPLLDWRMKPLLKHKVKRMTRVQKRVIFGSRARRPRPCESSHCPRQMLFLQQEKLGGNVNGQRNNKDKRKTLSAQGWWEKSSLLAVLGKENTHKDRFPHVCDTSITKSP